MIKTYTINQIKLSERFIEKQKIGVDLGYLKGDGLGRLRKALSFWMMQFLYFHSFVNKKLFISLPSLIAR